MRVLEIKIKPYKKRFYIESDRKCSKIEIFTLDNDISINEVEKIKEFIETLRK